MELSDAIKGRRSIRRFKPDPVPKEVIEKLLELAQWAPSAMNRQDWRFIVLQGPQKAELLKVTGSAFGVFQTHAGSQLQRHAQGHRRGKGVS